MPAPKPAKKATPKKTKPSERATLQRKMMAEEARWRAESDLRVLREAKQIEKDRARLARAKRLADKEMRALREIKSKR